MLARERKVILANLKARLQNIERLDTNPSVSIVPKRPEITASVEEASPKESHETLAVADL